MRDERKRGGNYPSELFARCNCENRYQNTAQLRLRLRLRARSLAFSAAVAACVWQRAHARAASSQREREETREKRERERERERVCEREIDARGNINHCIIAPALSAYPRRDTRD